MKRRFTRKHLLTFRRILLKRRAQLAGTYEHFRADALNGVSRRDGDLSTLPSECAELGTAVFEQEMALALLRNEADAIGKIDEAIERIDAGTFGVCDDCGREIPKARLKALPFATLCVRCRAAEEQLGNGEL